MAKRLTLKDHQRETKLFFRRVVLLSLIILILTGTLISRLVYLQVTQHNKFRTLSKLNQLELIPIKPNRGLIYDRNGVLLAENKPVFSLEIIPDRVKNLDDTLASLRKMFPITDEEIANFHKFAKRTRPSESVPLHLELTEDEQARFAVNRFKFPGVIVKARLIRHYPHGAALAHVLGYVGRINEAELQKVDPVNYSATNYIGKLGVEKYFEKTLHGKVGYEQVEIDASGRILRVLHRTDPIPGNNLYLSIDSQLETAIEKFLGDRRGAVVALNPQTGEVLALVSSPSYDPNPFVQGISHKDYKTLRSNPDQPLYNRAIRGQYPFASTIKPFLAVEGLESGIVNKKYRIKDPGYYMLPNSSHVYKDWKKRGHGVVNLRKAIIISCDTYFYHLAHRMGITRIDTILTKFGFGIKTKIEMGEELPGLVPSPAWKRRAKGQSWYPGDTLVSGIGQGYMLTTPLQLASGTATLGTHGKRMQPQLLLRQEMPDKTIIESKPKPVYPVELNNPEIWPFVVSAMRGVITQGTGYRFGRDAPYLVAGKTGTGQVFSAKFHAPFDDANLPERLRDHSLFIAFAPMDKPKIAIAVIVENSKLASNVARQTLDYYLLGKLPKNLEQKTDQTT